MKNPGPKARSEDVCRDWLLSITLNTVKKWMKDTRPSLYRDGWRNPDSREYSYSDRNGLYMHEVRWLQEEYPDEGIRAAAVELEQHWRSGYEEQQRRKGAEAEQRAKKEAERQRKAEEREERIEARKRLMAESLVAHKEQYPGDVRKAANRASQLYLGSPIPRTLKQCLMIAANEEQVQFAAIRSYLAGVGARALFAEFEGEVRETDREEV